MSDLSSDSPVSRGTPTEEELREAIDFEARLMANLARDLRRRETVIDEDSIQHAERKAECWRWLSEHVSGLLEDAERWRFCLENAAWHASEYEFDRFDYMAIPVAKGASLANVATRREAIDAARRALDSTSSPSEKQSVHPPVSSPPNQPGAR